MKRLIKFSFKHYFYFILILFVMAGTSIGAFFMTLESNFKVILTADSYKPIFVVANNDIYKIKRNQKVTLKINNKHHYGSVKEIFYDSEMRVYKAKISDIKVQMVPSSKIEAIVIYDSKKLYEILFG